MSTNAEMGVHSSREERPPTDKIKVFVSYARQDRDFVAQIVEALSAQDDIHVFRDTDDILPTEEWKGRLANLISQADTILFCLSPHSAVSDVCAWEIEQAEKLNKRIAPLVIKGLGDVNAPHSLAKLNYIYFTENEEFDQSLMKLVVALRTDISWIREHTRIGDLARQWLTRKRRAQLIRGEELHDAEQWTKYRPGTAPELSDDIISFIAASRQEAVAVARRKRWTQIGFGLLATLLLIGGVGWWQQDLLWEKYTWHWVMRPSVLTFAQEEKSAKNPGFRFTECANGCPKMVVVPAGKFKMGPRQVTVFDGLPPLNVVIGAPFAVSQYEITFGQWDACVSAGGCSQISDNGWGRGDQPAILMSWHEANDYAAWLTKMTGVEYRLLSEAEWEYATKAGSTAYWSFGDNEKRLTQFAWFDVNSKNRAHPVGKKAPNAFGLYDMHGNVAEWVEDCWNQTHKDASRNGRPNLQGDCSQRVTKGGSWLGGPGDTEAHYRIGIRSDQRLGLVGFRIARSLGRPQSAK